MKGFGNLRTPQDLLAKLRHDLARVKADPSDTDAAFDFFVTAEHMVDWVLPGYANSQARAELRRSSPLLQVISHIANGSKHFVAEAKHHEHVQRVDAPPGAFDSKAFAPHAFQTGALYVRLEGAAAAELGNEVLVVDLAEKAFEFWRTTSEETARTAAT